MKLCWFGCGILAVLLALVVGGLILLCLGYNPLLVYQTMLNGALAPF